MKITSTSTVNFKRRLKSSEEAKYSDVLKKGKALVSHSREGESKSILIVPAPSLPQTAQNNTGVGNLASEEAQKFFEFAKQYWGINEVQILPMGHYHNKHGIYIPYGGTSMDLGNHVINLKDVLPEKDFKEVVQNNKVSDRVNFSNVVDLDSISETMLKKLYKNMTPEMEQEFTKYKENNASLLERKSIFRALREMHGTHLYQGWNNKIDRNLFNEEVVSVQQRNSRIEEIKKLKSDSIDYFKFKNFLAEKSLKKAKEKLNAMGLKLCGDMSCAFALEEAWAHPEAFIKDLKMNNWGFPILDKDSPAAEKLVRERTRLFAKRYDGFRVDASWSYISPVVVNQKTRQKYQIQNGTKFLDIIDDEVKKVTGKDSSLNNIMHEFAANPQTEFNVFEGSSLKPYVRDRVKIYTSEYISSDWGTADAFLKRGWSADKLILGATNHDSPNMEPTKKQISALSKILKIPEEQLSNKTEFIKAKFAEPLRTKNNMIFFLPALGVDNEFKNLSNKLKNWAVKIPENYKDEYFKALTDGRGFNPMDALEKQFIAQGLDKKEPELFKKIVKYRKILEQKGDSSSKKKIIIAASIITAIAAIGVLSYKFILRDKFCNHQSSQPS